MPLSYPLPARLASFYFAFFAFSAAYVAYLPLWLAARGLQPAEIALVLALPQAARVFAPAGWGWLADRFGAQRGIVILSCAVMTAGFACLPAATGVVAIAVLIGITGLFSTASLPLVEAMTLQSVAGAVGRYGPVRLWGSVGFIAVLMAGGVWLDFGGVEATAPALAAFAAASLAVAVGLPKGAPHASPPPLAVAIPAGARAVLAAGFCMALAHGALYAFFTLHLQRAGYSGTAIGTLWTLGVLAEIVVFACLPALFRRYSLSAIMLASFLCAALRFVVIGWAGTVLWLIVAMQLLHAMTFGAFHAASVAAVHRLFPPEAQARGQSLFSSVAYGAGGASGALLAGWAWEAWGPELTFTLAGAAGLVGAHFAYVLKRSGL